jgi:hypothetical protein
MAMLRRLAVSILSHDTSLKETIRGNRYRAALSTDVLEQILAGFTGDSDAIALGRGLPRADSGHGVPRQPGANPAPARTPPRDPNQPFHPRRRLTIRRSRKCHSLTGCWAILPYTLPTVPGEWWVYLAASIAPTGKQAIALLSAMIATMIAGMYSGAAILGTKHPSRSPLY